MIYILIEGQTFIKKWTKRNREWYEQKGYVFTNYGDTFEIMANDLSKGSQDKVVVKCDYCGHTINVVWRDYFCRKDYGKYACTNCRLKKASETTLIKRRNDLYDKAYDVCKKYGYDLVTTREEITTSDSRINYICPKHGTHNTKIYTLISGHGCIDCSYEKVAMDSRLDYEYMNFYFNAHGCEWLNPNDYVNSTTKNLNVTCPDCRAVFTTSFSAFRKHDGQRCPDCTNIESKGEYQVRLFLEKNNISFIPQHRFTDCRNTNPLPFDFYLDKRNTVIEYDGAGHYIPIKRGNMTDEDAINALQQIKYRDDIKTKYCNDNNIYLIRIPYWDYDNIENILYKYLHEDIV